MSINSRFSSNILSLIITISSHNGGSKPSETECINGLKALQDAWDLECNSYYSKRRVEYPNIGDKLDDLYKKGAFSDEMTAKIKAVKDKYPKS